jgi:hypothetical protein
MNDYDVVVSGAQRVAPPVRDRGCGLAASAVRL